VLNLTVRANSKVYFFHHNGRNYQTVLRNNDPGYFGTVRRFNGDQVDSAIRHFENQLPGFLRDILRWLGF